ncbi:hypothetical protein FPQ18DRAFT_355357 [Pyronema domesticum]|nr:hypothetical protein FPQ18DRAFT_355357 [Pyronema domesticum]
MQIISFEAYRGVCMWIFILNVEKFYFNFCCLLWPLFVCWAFVLCTKTGELEITYCLLATSYSEGWIIMVCKLLVTEICEEEGREFIVLYFLSGSSNGSLCLTYLIRMGMRITYVQLFSVEINTFLFRATRSVLEVVAIEMYPTPFTRS